MDRRLTPANARVALDVLRGQVEAPRFTKGEAAQVVVPLADLRVAPDGARDRQVLLGDLLLVIERNDSWAFVQAAKDGFCGYLPEAVLGMPEVPTHWVASPGTHIYERPKVQARDLAAISLGVRLTVTGTEGAFAKTTQGYVPASHLRAIGQWHVDPVAVAQGFLGVPYLWGGNSRAGIDCSGLVQGALLSCGIACPGDSDLQQTLGEPIHEDAPLRRGDLLFWKGHVALVVEPDLMIHANGHVMAVSLENIGEGIRRILDQGGGSVTHRRRI